MFRPADDMGFIALFLEGFLYGLYTGIFAMYLRYRSSKQDTNKTQNILFYSMCALYVTSGCVFVCDTALCIYKQANAIDSVLRPIFVIQTTLFACSDFIAQFTLIYRCWIVWGRKTRIVIVPSILAFLFLGIWIAGGGGGVSTSEGLEVFFGLLYPTALVALALSLIVNALVTGLIVFRIFRVFREVNVTLEDKLLGATGGTKLRRTILVLIESAVMLFSTQLARFVLSFWIQTTGGAYFIVSAIHEMINGITPTIILVRIAMGLSFHDEKSMEEVAIESLRFASNHPNSALEMGSIGVVSQDIRGDDDIDIQRSNDIDIVERIG